MTAAVRMPSPLFDDQVSLSGSLGDFSESDNQQSPLVGLPSQHSGFRASVQPEGSEEQDEDDAASDVSPWSPPAWRQPTSAGGWYRHQPYSQDVERLKSQTHSGHGSRGTSKEHESPTGIDDEDATLAAKIPLPKGSLSPTKDSSPTRGTPVKDREDSRSSPIPKVEDGDVVQMQDSLSGPDPQNNCSSTDS